MHSKKKGGGLGGVVLDEEREAAWDSSTESCLREKDACPRTQKQWKEIWEWRDAGVLQPAPEICQVSSLRCLCVLPSRCYKVPHKDNLKKSLFGLAVPGNTSPQGRKVVVAGTGGSCSLCGPCQALHLLSLFNSTRGPSLWKQTHHTQGGSSLPTLIQIIPPRHTQGLSPG